MRLVLKGMLLIAIVLVVGNILLADVGYVLIRYGDIAIETSLLIAVLIASAGFLIIFSLIKRLPNIKSTARREQQLDQVDQNNQKSIQEPLSTTQSSLERSTK